MKAAQFSYTGIKVEDEEEGERGEDREDKGREKEEDEEEAKKFHSQMEPSNSA